MAFVLGFHLLLAAGLSLDAVRRQLDDQGGAPVINLTLEPRVAFDSVNGAEASIAVEAASGDATERPQDRPADPKTEVAQNAMAQTIPVPRVHQPVSPLDMEPVILRVMEARPAGSGALPGEAAATVGRKTGEGDAAMAADTSRRGMTEGGAGRTVGASGQPSADPYEAEVLRWIEAHKRHPGGMSGLVTVRFTLDRRGRLSGEQIVSGSGRPALDRATLQQLRAAQPFPRAPAGSDWRTREFTVRLDYRMRR